MLRCCLASKDKQFKGLSGGEIYGFSTLQLEPFARGLCVLFLFLLRLFFYSFLWDLGDFVGHCRPSPTKDYLFLFLSSILAFVILSLNPPSLTKSTSNFFICCFSRYVQIFISVIMVLAQISGLSCSMAF